MMTPESLPKLKRFDILETIGRGNTGTLYRAKLKECLGSLEAGHEVALKVLHKGLLADQASRDAFLKEARTGMAVRHPALLKVHAVEHVRREEGEILYLVLDYFKGQNLRNWIDVHSLALEPTLRSLSLQIVGALNALHDKGLVHLDVKPENILWDEEHALLADLGFARAVDDSADAPLFAGTPAYCAPEVLAGSVPTPAADLFSLGVMLYECATGMRPFGDEIRGIRAARSRYVFRQPSSIQPRLSAFFDLLVETLLSEDPTKRFSSTKELEMILQEGERSAWWQENAPLGLRSVQLHRDVLPFAGRDREMDRLEDAFDEVVFKQEPRVFLLRGPAGAGKTRLALEFASSLRRRNSAPPFLYGRCIGGEFGHGSAFRAVRTALARSLGLASDEAPSQNAIQRLQKSLPESAARDLIDILRGVPLPRETRRHAFQEWFRVMGEEGPFILCLDDLHAVSPSPLEFLLEVIEDQPKLPIFILLCLRDSANDRLEKAAHSLRSTEGSRLLELGDMQRSYVRKIVNLAFEDESLSPQLRTDLSRASQGNPGQLHDLLRFMKSKGDLSGKPGQFRAHSEVTPVPSSKAQADLLQEELGHLSERELSVLQWTSLLTPPIRLPLLAASLGQNPGGIARVLRRLRSRGWLRVSTGLYRFARPHLRQITYASMAATDRRACHRAVFHALCDLKTDWPGKQTAIAFHASRGHLHKQALRLGLVQLERHILHESFTRARKLQARLCNHAEALADELDKSLADRLNEAKSKLANTDQR